MRLDLMIRAEVRREDRDAVRRLAESTKFFRPDEVDVAVELVDAFLATGEASGYEFLFAEQNGHVVGYICYGLIGCTLGSYDVYWIVVDQQSQGAGIGRRLLQQAEQDLAYRNARLVYIETSNKPQYAPTRQFYLRCGYQIAAVMADFYDDGDDKVVLVRDLRNSNTSSVSAI